MRLSGFSSLTLQPVSRENAAMVYPRIRPARVDDAVRLNEIAVRATKHDGYDDDTVSRFTPGLDVNLALIAAGLVHVAEEARRSGRPCQPPTNGNGRPHSSRRYFRRPSLFAARCWHTSFRDRRRVLEKNGGKCNPDLFEPARGRFLCPPRRDQDRRNAVRILPGHPANDVRVYNSGIQRRRRCLAEFRNFNFGDSALN
jgi:hypothetical protein